MKGKKVDSEFLSEFISQCITSGFETPEQIVNYAKSLVTNIDEEIKKVEQQKITRSKLLDVINTFEKPQKSNRSEEIRALSFFQIQNSQICKFICDHIKNSAIAIKTLYDGTYSESDILFCVKQLLEHKIIHKTGDHLLRGDLYSEYLKFVFKDMI